MFWYKGFAPLEVDSLNENPPYPFNIQLVRLDPETFETGRKRIRNVGPSQQDGDNAVAEAWGQGAQAS